VACAEDQILETTPVSSSTPEATPADGQIASIEPGSSRKVRRNDERPIPPELEPEASGEAVVRDRLLQEEADEAEGLEEVGSHCGAILHDGDDGRTRVTF
jgi:hypothetical protein